MAYSNLLYRLYVVVLTHVLNNDLYSYIKQRTKLKVTHVRYTIQALANLL